MGSVKKILVFAGSNSTKSINRIFATYVGGTLENVELQLLDLNDYEMPIYSPEREEKGGVPELAHKFIQTVEDSQGIILSLAEHNGSYSAAFKNVLDWSSRHKQKLWSEKPMLLLSTSPGGRGGAGVLETAKQAFPHFGGQVVATFSLPSFQKNFDSQKGVINEELGPLLKEALSTFVSKIG